MNKTIYRVLFALFGLLLVSLLMLYAPRLFRAVQYPTEELTEWTIVSNEGEQISLPHTMDMSQNGKCTLYTTLPEKVGNNYAVCLWTYFSAVDAHLEEELIYHYDNSALDSFGEAPTSRWNVIELPQDAGGKRLTLSLQTPYHNVKLRLSEVLLGNQHSIHHWIQSRYYGIRFLDDSMLWVGTMFLLFSLIQLGKRDYKKNQLFSALFLILFSLYLRSATKAFPVEIISSFGKDFICYFTMYGMSIPLTLLIRQRVRRHTKQTLWCELLAIMQGLTLLTCFVLHAFCIVDIHYMLPLGLGLLAVSVLTGIYYALQRAVKERSLVSAIALAQPVLVLMILLLEYIQFYHAGTLFFDTGLVSRCGAVLVLGIQAWLDFTLLYSLQRRQDHLHEEHRSLQLQLLTDSIRPHFILNTIGAIRSIIDEDPKRASNLLYDFSKYIRKSLEQKDYFKMIPFTEELDHIKTYLVLEEARYGDSVSVTFDIRDKGFRILPLTIQPFVENSLKHGLSTSESGGRVHIASYELADLHVIEITDNGVGFDVKNLDKMIDNKKAIGLRSAMMRLEKKMNAKVRIRSDHGGTEVRIEIPKETK